MGDWSAGGWVMEKRGLVQSVPNVSDEIGGRKVGAEESLQWSLDYYCARSAAWLQQPRAREFLPAEIVLHVGTVIPVDAATEL